MRISIIIPTHERVRSLENLISSIFKQDFPVNEYEILIISNLGTSERRILSMLEQYKGLNISLYSVGSLGVNKARNLGLRSAKGEIALLLDDDCFLEDQKYLDSILLAHKNFSECLGIGGVYDCPLNAQRIDKAYYLVSKQWQSLDYIGSFKSNRLVGGNVSYKMDYLNKSNESFDENITFGATEAEFHFRLEKKGHKLICLDNLKVTHATQLTKESLIQKAEAQAFGHVRYQVDSGYSEDLSRTYQEKRLIWAYQMSQSKEEFDQICYFMDSYDSAFNNFLNQSKIELIEKVEIHDFT